MSLNTPGGAVMGAHNTSLLGQALDIWGRVEIEKAKRSTSGADLSPSNRTPDLHNGATIQLDESKKLAKPNANQQFELALGGLKIGAASLGVIFGAIALGYVLISRK